MSQLDCVHTEGEATFRGGTTAYKVHLKTQVCKVCRSLTQRDLNVYGRVGRDEKSSYFNPLNFSSLFILAETNNTRTHIKCILFRVQSESLSLFSVISLRCRNPFN